MAQTKSWIVCPSKVSAIKRWFVPSERITQRLPSFRYPISGLVFGLGRRFGEGVAPRTPNGLEPQADWQRENARVVSNTTIFIGSILSRSEELPMLRTIPDLTGSSRNAP